MNLFQRQSIQSRLEQLLVKQGKLEAFKNSDIFHTTFLNDANLEMRLVKFHEIVTCYFLTEEHGHIEDSPSATMQITETGRWKYLARHRATTFSRNLKAA